MNGNYREMWLGLLLTIKVRMAEAALIQALESNKSTIFFGNLGREPELLEFYLRPHVYSQDYAWSIPPRWFMYKDRNVFIWPEPAFGEKISSRWKHLVFTSHLDLEWDPNTTDIIVLHVGIQTPLKWTMDPRYPFEYVTDVSKPLPNTRHVIFSTGDWDPHTIYMQMFELEKRIQPHQTWSLAIPKPLERKLSKSLEKSWQNYKSLNTPLLIGYPHLGFQFSTS